MHFPAGFGLLLTAGALGLTHGLEPDHVAGITALTHEAGDPKLSALVGGCFAVGHAILVVIWIAIAYLFLGVTSFPQVFEQVGLLLVGVLLSVLGLYLGITGTRRLIHKHDHDHGDGPHTHYHLHLPAFLRSSADDPGEPVHDHDPQTQSSSPHTHDHGSHTQDHGPHAHDHGLLEYLKIGTIGALFTLSPPVSMIAFISVTMSKHTDPLIVGVVAAYTVSIVATMAAIGAGAGSLFLFSKAKGRRVHAISQMVASVIVFAYAVHLLAGVVPSLLH